MERQRLNLVDQTTHDYVAPESGPGSDVYDSTLSTSLRFLSPSHTGFWDSPTCRRRKGSGLASPERPPLPVSSAAIPGHPGLRTRTPSELERCQSNGALCFINPLFIKVHQPDGDRATASNPSAREEPVSGGLETDNEDARGDRVSDRRDGGPSGQSDLQRPDGNPEPRDDSGGTGGGPKISAADSAPRSPPPRPPPPRVASQLLRKRRMPEKIPWVNGPKEKERERCSSLLFRLSSSLSISPSSSPPKRLSSPISIPRPSLPSSSSSSGRRATASPSSSQEDAQCHLALEEQTIESALVRAVLCRRNAARTLAQGSVSPPGGTPVATGGRAEATGRDEEEEAGEERGARGQRLSDMSLSTDSSDSLDFSQSSAFFLPPLRDPKPPTADDFNAHLPLSLPPSRSTEDDDEDEDDEDDDEDDEDPDYGVGLESDQDQDLTMVPPGLRARRRPSAGALILQRALRRHLRKMSGVFNSLLTPEKRAIRRVVELSRDKGSYFGCLVRDYLGYMGEGAGTQALQGYASGLELLQTLRQFITQMKSYLRQSSELEPPIESLIPEDQIGEYLYVPLRTFTYLSQLGALITVTVAVSMSHALKVWSTAEMLGLHFLHFFKAL